MAISSGSGAPADGSSDRTPDDKRPVLITEAQASFEEQQRARIRKYSIMMGVRIPALVLAALAYTTWHNGWIALAIIAVSIPLPWMAVLIANDRPPRTKDEPRRYDHKTPPAPELDGPAHKTIEG
ncbi:DUF3099 domain-containing protein [Speluncibacter jeojiensis]|uniref:DUF3099 domain-containing protein n=1 Tax=Speluncibacter jeojiensis TaxID=2710754 RepID=A0A9X4M4B7_9ACTN|nr:DUF3099 domain-containing protein [Corynebacteriales bacterium D3-21]